MTAHSRWFSPCMMSQNAELDITKLTNLADLSLRLPGGSLPCIMLNRPSLGLTNSQRPLTRCVLGALVMT